MFLAKYLCENKFPKSIAATILIAAPYDDESVEDLTDFKVTKISETFLDQTGRVIFFNGEDDPVVSFSEMEKYKLALPEAQYNVISAPDHFSRAEFPELVSVIQKINDL